VTPLELLFWTSLSCAVYACCVYPGAIWLLARRTKPPAQSSTQDANWPFVSLVVLAPSDCRQTREWVHRCNRFDYPHERLEIVIASPQSAQYEAVKSVTHGPRVSVVELASPADGVQFVAELQGDIVVFTRVDVSLGPDAIRRLARHFRNRDADVLSGRLVATDSTTGRQDTTPWRNFGVRLQRCESQCGIPARVEPAICAMRRSLFASIVTSGFTQRAFELLRLRAQRTVLDPSVVAVESSHGQPSRALLRWFESLLAVVSLLRAVQTRASLKAVVAESHRALRMAAPACLLAAMVANVLLSNDPTYLRILLFHEAAYVLAAVAWWIYQRHAALDLSEQPLGPERNPRASAWSR
jgi:hypothetical protein